MIAAGLPCVAPTGRGKAAQIIFREAFDWMVARELRRHRATDGGLTLAQAELEKARADVRRAKVRAADAEDRVVDRVAALQLLHHLIDLCAQRMSVLPAALCDRLALETEPSVIRDVVFHECRAVRQRLADDYAAMAEREGAASDA